MILNWNKRELEFHQVELHFVAHDLENIFANKNNKSLRETLEHRRYKKFTEQAYSRHSDRLDWPLGEYLLHLKTNGNNFYQLFLNKYGDRKYCNFYMDDEKFINKPGLYSFFNNGELRYIGRCLDSYKKRLNQGYGKIHPKNCYLDGQATNCHLNALIAENYASVSFYVCPLSNETEIRLLEKELIKKYQPPWNISR